MTCSELRLTGLDARETDNYLICVMESDTKGRAREMTQKEVADLLGISQSYISRLEKKIMVRLKKSIQNNV